MFKSDVQLEILKYIPKGFFVDVGAFDGVHGGETHFLEYNGWNGICIEGNSNIYNLLVKNRQCICINEVIDSEQHEVEFVEQTIWGENLPHFPGCGGSLISSNIDDYSRVEHILNNCGGKKTIRQTKTIGQILEQMSPNKINFLKIDIEGHDYEVLSTFPFFLYKPEFIHIEASPSQRIKIIEFMNKTGYPNYKDHTAQIMNHPSDILFSIFYSA
jgi:FkbM family methyltransferase